MAHITLNRTHFFHNLDLIATKADTKEKIAIVLKDNAYGHGLNQMAQLAHEYGISHAVVRTLQEAQSIEPLFKTILILADTPKETVSPTFYFAVNDIQTLKTLPKFSAIELKCDTGMHRNGIAFEELDSALELIKSRQLRLKGLFTHHRSADELSSEYFWQEKNFDRFVERVRLFCRKHELELPRFHSQNSAATLRSFHHRDLVRVGIAAYGLLEMPEIFSTASLKPVLSLYAQKLHTFEALNHFRFGYGGAGTIASNMTLSTYDIGYADGLLRLNDAQSYTLPDQEKLIGRISMDNIILSGDKESQLIFDDARAYAQAAQTIAYEVVVRLAPSLQRDII